MRFFNEGRLIADSELPLQRAVTENREIPCMELEVQLPSGRRWFAEGYGAPVRDAQGRVVGGVAGPPTYPSASWPKNNSKKPIAN